MENISVLMSTYNEPERFLRQSIESILGQTHSNFEFIIILDKPENVEIEHIVLEYASKDARIRFYKNDENMGLARSLNRAIELSSFDILARMDADDIAEPELLKKDLIFLKENPQLHMVSVNCVCINENNEEIRPRIENFPTNFEVTKRRMNYRNCVLHPGVMFYKKDLVEIGGYRNFPATQDYDLWLRYITKGWEFGFLDECLIRYRLSENNTTYGRALRQWICDKYLRELYKERKKAGKDSFSEKELLKRMNKAGCSSIASSEKFNRGRTLVSDSKGDLQRHKYFSSLIKLIRAFFKHKEMPSYVTHVLISAVNNRI